MEQRTKIGYLVGGGLKENFRVRLVVSPQEMQEGRRMKSSRYCVMTIQLLGTF